jgi:AraC-like DNA-binding protein
MIKPIDIINCISVFQLAYFTFYIFHQGKKTLSNFLLGAYFIAQFLVLFNFASFNIFSEYPHFCVHTVFLSVPVSFLWGPLMYLYICSQIRKKFVLQLIHSIHLLPCLIALIYYAFTYYKFGYDQKVNLLQSGVMNIRNDYCSMFGNIQVCCYNVLSLFILIRYQRELKNYSSSIEKQNLIWLKTVLFGYIMACIVTESLFFFGNEINISNDLKGVVIFGAFLIFFNVLFYKAMIHPHVFIGLEQKPKKQSPTLYDADTMKNIQILEDYISYHKPFLNPSLTLKELSDATHIAEKIISHIINQHYNKNFFNYINSFRIEEAKKLMTSTKIQNTTMLGIAFDAGFNSKTVFYDTFKKIVGMTPSEFRQLCA